MPGWLKKLLLSVSLIAVIGCSFWISYRLGKQMFLPTRNLPAKLVPEQLKQKPAVNLSDISIEVETTDTAAPPFKKAAAPKAAKVKTANYMVQAGAFRYYKNATNQVAKLKGKGFDSYSTKSGNLYQVIAGSFNSLPEAEKLVSSLKIAGFDAVVKK